MTEEETNALYANPAIIFKHVRDNLKTDAVDIYSNVKDESVKLIPANEKIKIAPDKLLKRTKDLLGDKWVEKIKGLKRDKPILIVGGNDDPISLITSYIYLTHPVIASNQHAGGIDMFEVDKLTKGYTGRICFKEEIYTGLSKDFIENDLFFENKINHSLGGGGMLFLRGIDSKHKEIFEHITEKAKGSYYENGRGVLIISTDNLPSGLKDHFETIYLKTRILFDANTKTITVNDKNFPNIPDREYTLFKLLYDNQKRHVTKDEIAKILVTGGEYEDSQIFKLFTYLRNTFKGCPLKFDNIRKTKNQKGGYRLIIQD